MGRGFCGFPASPLSSRSFPPSSEAPGRPLSRPRPLRAIGCPEDRGQDGSGCQLVPLVVLEQTAEWLVLCVGGRTKRTSYPVNGCLRLETGTRPWGDDRPLVRSPFPESRAPRRRAIPECVWRATAGRVGPSAGAVGAYALETQKQNSLKIWGLSSHPTRLRLPRSWGSQNRRCAHLALRDGASSPG